MVVLILHPFKYRLFTNCIGITDMYATKRQRHTDTDRDNLSGRKKGAVSRLTVTVFVNVSLRKLPII